MARAGAIGAVVGVWMVSCLCCTPGSRGSAIVPARPTSGEGGFPKSGEDSLPELDEDGFPKSGATESDFPDGTNIVATAEQSAWAEEKASTWIALLAPDAVIVTGRGPQPDPYDVHFAKEGYAKLLAYQFSGHALQDRFGRLQPHLHHEDVRLEGHGERRVLELTRVLNYADCDEGDSLEERTQVRYTLRRLGGTWQIAQMRWWPLSIHSCDPKSRRFDADGLRQMDAKIASYAENQPREKGEACFDALRYAESADWYEKAAGSAKGEPRDWLLLGWSAAFAGQMDRARKAFAEALRRDPTLPVPPITDG